jgi:hypothetical protein
MQPGLKRSDPCPCGSGLKYKKCHGNATIINGCTEIAQYMLLKLISKARYAAGLIDEEEYNRLAETAICAIRQIAGEYEPSCEKECEPEDEVVTGGITELQEGLERCPNCGRPTFGKECIKCKKQEKSDVREQD